MASTQNFRTAFNGFNRDDVVNYISYMTTKHENQLNQLRSELDVLRQELAERPAADTTELEALREQVAQLQQSLQEKDAQLAAARTAPISAPAPVAAEPSFAEQELSAYRRAESAERRAMERVDRLYAQANGMVADAAARMDEQAAQIGMMAQQVLTDLEALHDAVAESKTVLSDSAKRMAAMRPEQ